MIENNVIDREILEIVKKIMQDNLDLNFRVKKLERKVDFMSTYQTFPAPEINISEVIENDFK